MDSPRLCGWSGCWGQKPSRPGPLEPMQARAVGGQRRAGTAGPNAKGQGGSAVWRSGGVTAVLQLGDALGNSEIHCNHHDHKPSLRPMTRPRTQGDGAWQGGSNSPFAPASPPGRLSCSTGDKTPPGLPQAAGGTAQLLGQWGDSTHVGPVLPPGMALCSAEGKEKNLGVCVCVCVYH